MQKLLLEGKSKRLYLTDDPAQLILYFKDDAMAYHGLKRGRIVGKGEVNNAICEHLFTMLAKEGVENHYIRRLDDTSSLIRHVQMIPVVVTVRNFAAGSLCKRLRCPEGTPMVPTVIEYNLKTADFEDPLINISHIIAMHIATREEVDRMNETALRVNEILSRCMREIGIELIDFKLEFGRDKGKVIVADEISPDTARFWDANTREPMDIDRFRNDLGNVEQGYREILRRLMGTEE
ncbi:MAG: phosphoribosylaminoimidazolesuccinocarboxamide synthase [Clostridia bacterium]|nr:phosphoribosylaminoimidazolesuccinocarboxamide synthase [Clostridia bacterium]